MHAKVRSRTESSKPPTCGRRARWTSRTGDRVRDRGDGSDDPSLGRSRTRREGVRASVGRRHPGDQHRECRRTRCWGTTAPQASGRSRSQPTVRVKAPGTTNSSARSTTRSGWRHNGARWLHVRHIENRSRCQEVRPLGHITSSATRSAQHANPRATRPRR